MTLMELYQPVAAPQHVVLVCAFTTDISSMLSAFTIIMFQIFPMCMLI